MYKLRWEDNKEILEQYRKDFGDYNDIPQNLKEITPEEFAKSKFFTYSPEHIEHRQMKVPPADPNNKWGWRLKDIKLYTFFDKTGIGISNDGGKVTYYSFCVCEHEYEELSPSAARALGHQHFGNCYHVIRCSKCGYVQEYDSSG